MTDKSLSEKIKKKLIKQLQKEQPLGIVTMHEEIIIDKTLILVEQWKKEFIRALKELRKLIERGHAFNFPVRRYEEDKKHNPNNFPTLPTKQEYSQSRIIVDTNVKTLLKYLYEEIDKFAGDNLI